LCRFFYILASNLIIWLYPVVHYEKAAKDGNDYAMDKLRLLELEKNPGGGWG
jgi:hypothetical protein